MTTRSLVLLALVAGCSLGDDAVDREAATLQLEKLEDQLLRHASRKGDLPDSLSEVTGELPLDPWGGRVQYRRLGHDRFELLARGADGAVGGEGADADVSVIGRLP
ncbi:MAG: type II secretion system protein GspG [Alphaproteobacteria bacterium]|nr:type II secretion system protein GspG [Alphaproteobacteria bacterium]